MTTFNLSKRAEQTEKGVVEQYIEMLQKMMSEHGTPKGFVYGGLYDFLMKHGKKYTSQPLNAGEMRLLKDVLKRSCDYKLGQCYFNAQKITVDSFGKIRYIEGVATNGLIPMDHAWNSINGKILDFTWKHRNENQPVLGVLPDGWEYWGVEFTREEINRYWAKFGESNAFLQNYKEKFALYTKPYIWPDEREKGVGKSVK